MINTVHTIIYILHLMHYGTGISSSRLYVVNGYVHTQTFQDSETVT